MTLEGLSITFEASNGCLHFSKIFTVRDNSSGGNLSEQGVGYLNYQDTIVWKNLNPMEWQ